MAFPILGSGDPSSGYNIENSLKYNGANQYLYKTPGSASNRRTWTFSCWFKRGNIASAMNIWTAGADVSNRCHFDINSSGTFQVEAKNGGTQVLKFENAGGMVLRDPTAWYHLVWRVDTTDGTASNRSRVYINGILLTFTGSNSFPSQNTDMAVNDDVLHRIGARTWETSNLWSGYISEVHFVDGSSLAPTSFAETNDNGVWIPKNCKADLTYGTNGFFLESKQSGTGQNSSGVGADTSGQDNHFAQNAHGSNSPSTDTPTNNFCTLNPLDVRQGASFTGGGNISITTNSSNRNYVTSTMGVTSGKWYAEARVTSGANQAWFGVADLEDLNYNAAQTPGDMSNEIGLNYEGTYQKNNSNNSGWSGSYADNDIMGILIDMDNNRITYHKNGSYSDGSGNFDESSPTAYLSFTNSTMTFIFGDGGGAASTEYDVNFGGTISFTVNSGNADANGYGNFEYAVPSGYYALCTKNLAEYG